MDGQKALEASKQPQDRPAKAAEDFFHLGAVYSELGDKKTAIAAFQEALRLRPNFAGAHFSLGMCHLTLRDLPAAWQEYEALKTLDESLALELFHLIELAWLRDQLPARLKKSPYASNEPDRAEDARS